MVGFFITMSVFPGMGDTIAASMSGVAGSGRAFRDSASDRGLDSIQQADLIRRVRGSAHHSGSKAAFEVKTGIP
jgi:hypothetical protein